MSWKKFQSSNDLKKLQSPERFQSLNDLEKFQSPNQVRPKSKKISKYFQSFRVPMPGYRLFKENF